MYFFDRLLVCLLAFAVIFSAGCSKDEKPEQGTEPGGIRIAGGDTAAAVVERPKEPYKGWATYTFQNIKVHYPPEHPRADLVPDMVRSYEALLRRDAQFFRIPVPRDTVEVYFYTGVGHGNKVTGTIYPHVDSVVHQWLPGNYGPLAAGYMLQRWQAGEPKHEFLKQGAMKLLDFTGRNYHQLTVDLVAARKFVPLRELAADTAFTIDTDPDRAGEAASFVDYVVFTHGIEALRTLYTSVDPFETVAEQVFAMPLDTLEARWLDLARRAVNPEQVVDSLASRESGADSK